MLIKMNAVQVEAVFQSKLFKYGIRVVILYIFSIVFKSFDLSFPKDFGTFLFRGQAFSLMFVLVGLVVWAGAVRLSKYLL
jgi:two-component system LytT family sensor kinase